mgnify:CR=1 FL=1|jgi:hypothetical protein
MAASAAVAKLKKGCNGILGMALDGSSEGGGASKVSDLIVWRSSHESPRLLIPTLYGRSVGADHVLGSRAGGAG